MPSGPLRFWGERYLEGVMTFRCFGFYEPMLRYLGILKVLNHVHSLSFERLMNSFTRNLGYFEIFHFEMSSRQLRVSHLERSAVSTAVGQKVEITLNTSDFL